MLHYAAMFSSSRSTPTEAATTADAAAKAAGTPVRLRGWCTGQLDLLYSIRLLAGSCRPLLYSRGWGEHAAAVDAAFEKLQARLRAGASPLDGPLYIYWHVADPTPRGVPPAAAAAGGVAVRVHEGRATSPLASLLPAGVDTMRFMYVSDARCACPLVAAEQCASDSSRSPALLGTAPAAIILLLPATGEQGYGQRLSLSRKLIAAGSAAGRRAACLLLMAPFYAARRPPGQRGHYVNTVADYQAQSLAIMHEAAALLAWAHAAAPAARLAVSGFSWGAAMSAAAGLLAVNALPRGVAAALLAVVPYVGSASLAPIVDGILAGDIDWRALVDSTGGALPPAAAAAAGDGSGGGGGVTLLSRAPWPAAAAAARVRLRSLLAAASTAKLVEALRASPAARDEPAPLAAVVSVGMLDDAFVPPHFCGELHGLLAGVVHRGRSRIDWHPGGHVWAFLRKQQRQAAAIAAALDMLCF